MPAPEWDIIEYRGRAGLVQLEADWRRLYAKIPLRTSFLAFEANLAHVDHVMAMPDQLRCLALTDGQQIRAICALEPRVERALGRPIPIWAALWHHHARQADVLCPDDEARRELVSAVAAHLRRESQGRWLLLLGQLPATSALWDGLRRLGRSEHCEDQRDSVCFVDCSKSFEETRASLAKKFRHNLNTSAHRLARLDDVRFVTASDAADIEREFPTFLEIEASGWKGEGGTGTAVQCCGDLPDYFRDLGDHLCGDADHCEIHALYAEGRCLASLFSTRTGGTFSALKIGYDESYAWVSPGRLLMEKVVERCCNDPDVERLDVVGDAPWLRGWCPEWVPLRLGYVAIDRWRGRPLIALLKLRFGHARSFVRWLRSKSGSAKQDAARDWYN